MPTTAIQPFGMPDEGKPTRSRSNGHADAGFMGNGVANGKHGPGAALREVAAGAYPNFMTDNMPVPMKIKDGKLELAPLDGPPDVDVIDTDRHPDQFMNALEHLGRIHQDQIDQLLQVNEQLTVQMNTCLQATWGMSEDGWHGKRRGAPEATLVLTTHQNSQKQNAKSAWTVPENFNNPMRQTEEDPDNFILRGMWKYTGEADLKKVMSGVELKNVANQKSGKIGSKSPRNTENKGQKDPGCARFMVDPSSSKRVGWDVLCAVILLYDIIMVPVGAFKPEENDFFLAMDWLTLCFWTSDMVASLLTGYTSTKNGLTVMSFPDVALNYLKRWFILDVIIVVPDWIVTILALKDKGDRDSGGGSETKMTRLIRIFRMVRVLRLFRLAKLQRMIQTVKDNIRSELVFKVANIIQIFVGLMFVCHLTSAGWYFIGDIGIETDEPNWIQSIRGFEEDPVSYRYLTSLHWAIAHFGLGSMKVEPQSNIERLFSIVVTLGGILFFSFFTAYLANALVQANLSQTNSSKQLWLLRRFLRQHNVNAYLNYRVLRYAEFKCKNIKEVLPETQVTVLHELSEHLRAELKFEVQFSGSVCHPLINYMYSISDVSVHHLAVSAFTMQSMGYQDMLFKEAAWQIHMYIVISGELEYKKVRDKAYTSLPKAGDWLCEASIWVPWMTRGSAMSVADSQVILVDIRAFSDQVVADDGMWAFVSHYGNNYSEWINDQNLADLLDVNMKAEFKNLSESFIHRHVDESEKDRERRLKKKRQQRAAWRREQEIEAKLELM